MLGILVIVAGVIMIVAGVFTWVVVQTQLADENITVSEDADRFAGDPVDGPLTAYAEADVIETHALEASGGLTYAEIDREDPVRETVMTASFLRSSLFTSIVAFGVALMAAGLGRRVDPHRHRPHQDRRSVRGTRCRGDDLTDHSPPRRTGSSVDGGTSAARKSATMRATSTGRSSGTAWEEPGRIANCPAGSAS